ncbi:ABC transporter permease [Flaviflexus huanghaiensis]|uniref:ABC transporter permease n=1 Tax=Flaviflexus huanghaiensis TaxID=1111473 RepID=UPI0015F7A9C3|nr:ABC transporter permease subunit [Flaviflexus huanghaiensis]
MFRILIRHELRGMLRTWRAPVLAGVVIFLALIGPVITKLMPQIISLVGGGLEILGGDPTSVNAYAQWASDLSQVIPLLTVMVAAYSIAQPLSSGSAALLLARPVPRSALLLAPAVANALITAVAVIIGALGNSVMTAILFGEGELGTPMAMALRWLVLMAVLIAAAALGAALRGSMAGAAGVGLGVYFALALLSAVPGVRDYSPAGLFSLEGGETWGWAALTAVPLIALMGVAATRAFDRLPLASSPHS